MTTPFLGCKISLISKSEIRYEGILYTIDPKESTIALAKVKSYGTEDRQVERPVAPRDEIFEYIIFRANDIKDLIVDDPPTSMAPSLADPAIIQAHSMSTSTSTFPPATNSFPPVATSPGVKIPGPAAPTSSSQAAPPPGQRANLASFQTGPPTNVAGISVTYTSNSVGSRSGNSTPTGQRGGGKERPAANNVVGSKPQNDKHLPPRDTRNQTQQNQRRSGPGGGANHQFNQNHFNKRGGGGGNQTQNYRPNYSQMGQQRNARPQHGGSFGGGGGGGGGFQQRRPNNMMGNRNHTGQQRSGAQNRPRRTEPLKFDADYDFDKANEEFLELEKKLGNCKISNNEVEGKEDGAGSGADENNVEVKSEPSANANANANADGNDSQADPFYDKTKSFFDSISCEALERSKGNVQRVDRRAERKMNTETFGASAHYWRGGYRRGHGGRGHHRHRGFNSMRTQQASGGERNFDVRNNRPTN